MITLWVTKVTKTRIFYSSKRQMNEIIFILVQWKSFACGDILHCPKAFPVFVNTAKQWALATSHIQIHNVHLVWMQKKEFRWLQTAYIRLIWRKSLFRLYPPCSFYSYCVLSAAYQIPGAKLAIASSFPVIMYDCMRITNTSLSLTNPK